MQGSGTYEKRNPSVHHKIGIPTFDLTSDMETEQGVP